MNRARPSGSTDRRRSYLALAVLPAGALLLSGCEAFPQNIFQPRSEFADSLDALFKLILIMGAVVFVVVEAALIFAALRFRRKPGDALPKQIHGSKTLEITWTVIPAIVLGVILVPSTATIFATQAPAPAGSVQVTVTGHQFWWEFTYPELDVHTANEIHMPVGKTINIAEQSADVIHSFWLPALGGKRDVVPGHTNYLWWTPRDVGTYLGQCGELCGASHANMRMRGMVDSQQEFDAWVAAQKAPAATPPAGSDAEKGAQLFQTRGCASCHTIRGTPAAATVGPELTHVGSRTTIAGGVLENNAANLRTWIHDPSAVKPGALMPNLGLSDDELNVLVAYLQSLK